ncbi:MAG TPA: hypothetical protein VFU97_15800 [Xanthobacteraceae bacterium]|nr:hypothetical protein [Xanthobacteraceae bacterium]
MRRLVLVLALVVGFFIIAGHAGEGFRVVGVAAAGTLCGFTLTLSDYVIDGSLDRGDRERLAADRRDLEPIDWGGRLIGFGLLAWLAWRRFGRPTPQQP